MHIWMYIFIYIYLTVNCFHSDVLSCHYIHSCVSQRSGVNPNGTMDTVSHPLLTCVINKGTGV